MKKRVLALALTLMLCLGLIPATQAAGASFSDVPESHWAYADVEAAASAGLMNGTGNGAFSPDMKVSAAQFLTLVGRVVFPEVKAEGADWYGPYVSVAQSMGLLEGTLVNVDDLGVEITRYDMAAILQAAAKVMGINDKTATQSDVADYMDIPNRYTQAVLAVYGMGLIRGDQEGRFNGANTMTRAEVAVVVNRLAQVQVQGATYRVEVRHKELPQDVLVVGESTYVWDSEDPWSEAPYKIDHDLAGFSCTSSNTDVVTVAEGINTDQWLMTAVGVGTATVTITDPYGVSGSREVTVVEQRENMGTTTQKVYMSPPYYETYTLRGAANTKSTYLSAVPYEIRYTRDGGKTFQVVYTGVTPAFEEGDWYKASQEIELEFPEGAFYGLNSGLYCSIDAVVDGQRWVTPDRRTDGRNRAEVRSLSHAWKNDHWVDDTFYLNTKLTPPEGEKISFVFDGHLRARRSAGGYAGAANFAVQLRLSDGTIVGETIANEGGVFSMDCVIDVLDLPDSYFTSTNIFAVTYTGDLDGDHYEWQSVRPYYSFESLHIWDSRAKGPDSSRWEYDVSPVKQ